MTSNRWRWRHSVLKSTGGSCRLFMTPDESAVEGHEGGDLGDIGSIQVADRGAQGHIQRDAVFGGDEATGFAEGSTAGVTRLRLVASATLDALRQL